MQDDLDELGPRLTRGEYWLLETAADEMVGLPNVAQPDREVAMSFNKPGHGLTSKQLAQTLAGLFARRWIYALRYDCNAFYPRTETEIEALCQGPSSMSHEQKTFYGLTQEGGRQWELFARANWDSYLSFSAEESQRDPHHWHAEVVCPTKRRVEIYVSEARGIGQEIVKHTIEWDVLRPWKATYWKELPEGHRARYVYVERDDLLDPYPSGALLGENRRWCRWR